MTIQDELTFATNNNICRCGKISNIIKIDSSELEFIQIEKLLYCKILHWSLTSEFLQYFFIRNGVTIDILNRIKKINKNYVHDICSYLMKNKINTSSIVFVNSFSGMKYNKNIIEYLLKIDEQNYDELVYFYKTLSNKYYQGTHTNIMINNIININFKNHKITTELLEAVCCIVDEKNITDILQNRIIISEKCFNKLLKNRNFDKLSDILIKYGYEVTYNNILKSIKYKKMIPNIKIQNIVCDDKIMYASSKQRFFDYDKILDFPYTLEFLYHECEYGVLENILKIVKKGIVPDNECMKRACKSKNKKACLNYLIDTCGIQPDIECLKIVVNTYNDKLMAEMINKMEK